MGKSESNKYTVKLAACGNPDHREDADSNIVNGKAIPDSIAEANTLEECQYIVCSYITEHDLGGGNWDGGQVYQNGEQVGYISYNGRYWTQDSQYYR